MMETVKHSSDLEIYKIHVECEMDEDKATKSLLSQGTAALAPSWHFVLSNYLNTIIGSFRGNASDEQRNPVTNVEMSLVIFYSRSSNSACLVQRSGWTNNFENFLGWLSSIQFSGDDLDAAVVASRFPKCYRLRAPASASGAANWPSDMHILGLISQDNMNMHFKAYAAGKNDFLVLRAMTPHGFFQQQLVEKKFQQQTSLVNQLQLLEQTQDIVQETLEQVQSVPEGQAVEVIPKPLVFEELYQDSLKETIRCNCKKSKCLKLYCECFAAEVYCIELCSCVECSNKSIHKEVVFASRERIKSRNPLAFAPKVIVSDDAARHKLGCNCKNSKCLMKYCECYQSGVGCSIYCRCQGCANKFGQKIRFKTKRGARWPI